MQTVINAYCHQCLIVSALGNHHNDNDPRFPIVHALTLG